MRIMVAGVSDDKQHVRTFESWERMTLREGDSQAVIYGTRGDVARTRVCNEFLSKPQFDALMLCDLDQLFPKDTLEKLRAHDVDMVSVHYMKRLSDPLQSIWAITHDGSWPFMPVLDIPTEGLHRIAQTGMGGVLIKREVIESVNAYLGKGSSPFEIGKIPELTPNHSGNFGSDYRFFFYAQMLGYELWGDASIDTPHAATMFLTRDLYNRLGGKNNADQMAYLSRGVLQLSAETHEMITLNALEARRAVLSSAVDALKDDPEAQFDNSQLSQKQQDYISAYIQRIEIDYLIATLRNQVEADNNDFELDDGTYVRRVGRNGKLKVPVFQSEAEAKAAIANRDKAIGGETEEEAIKKE